MHKINKTFTIVTCMTNVLQCEFLVLNPRYIFAVSSQVYSNKVASATDLPYSLGVEVLSFLLDLICIISPYEAEPFGYFAKPLVVFA